MLEELVFSSLRSPSVVSAQRLVAESFTKSKSAKSFSKVLLRLMLLVGSVVFTIIHSSFSPFWCVRRMRVSLALQSMSLKSLALAAVSFSPSGPRRSWNLILVTSLSFSS